MCSSCPALEAWGRGKSHGCLHRERLHGHGSQHFTRIRCSACTGMEGHGIHRPVHYALGWDMVGELAARQTTGRYQL